MVLLDSIVRHISRSSNGNYKKDVYDYACFVRCTLTFSLSLIYVYDGYLSFHNTVTQ